MSTLTDYFGRNANLVAVQNCNRGYSAAFSVACAASATDVAVITGSASRIVVPRRIVITGLQTVGLQVLVLAIKRSTADTGGTPVAQTLVPHDSSSPAATGTVTSYTANPGALGTAVGTVRREQVFIQAPATVGVGGRIEWIFGRDSGLTVLRGVAQQLAINLNAVTVTGGVLDIQIELDEEPN